MNLNDLRERIQLLESTLKQHVDQINALNGHLAESKHWEEMLKSGEQAAREYMEPVVEAVEEVAEAVVAVEHAVEAVLEA